jgi:putative spermidine/putrescine transport system substrate-binding protein
VDDKERDLVTTARDLRLDRRRFLIGAGAVAFAAACGPGRSPAGGSTATATASATGVALPALPQSAIGFSVIDVAGQLQLTKAAIEDYAKQNSKYVSGITFSTATAPELPAKLKAQQQANNVQLHFVLTGSDGLSAGVEQGLFTKITPDYEKKFPSLMDNYLQPKAQDLAQGYGILVVYGNYGPTFTYNPSKLPNVPKTADDFLAWAKANPKQLIYARPANSGPGRSMLMGLPYILGESNPRDPNSWTKVWPFYEELGKYVEYYTTGTAATFKELGQGARTIALSTMGWDLNVRVLGTVPKDFKAASIATRLVADTQYVCIPKGVDNDHLAVALDLAAWMLKPEQQAKAYDNAFFYPGPAVKNVTLQMAPKENQDAVASVVRPDFDDLIKKLPIENPLETKALVTAFEIWDKRIGSGKMQ